MNTCFYLAGSIYFNGIFVNIFYFSHSCYEQFIILEQTRQNIVYMLLFYSAFFSCIYVIMPTYCRLSSLVVVIRIFTVTESCPSCVLLMSACIIMQSSVRNIAFIYHCPYLYAQDDEQI